MLLLTMLLPAWLGASSCGSSHLWWQKTTLSRIETGLQHQARSWVMHLIAQEQADAFTEARKGVLTFMLLPVASLLPCTPSNPSAAALEWTTLQGSSGRIAETPHDHTHAVR